MIKNETIAIDFDATATHVKKNLDILQYALIGLGYEYPTKSGPQQFSSKNGNTIYLELKTNVMTWDAKFSDKKWAYADIRFTGTNLVEVVDFVKNPPSLPKNEITIEEICGDMNNSQLKFVVDVDAKTVSAIFSKNDRWTRRLVNNVKISSDTIVKINEALGNKRTLPLIRFNYPDSRTYINRTRIVRLVQVTDDHIRGYELVDEQDEKGTYKQFSKSRVVGSVGLLSFNC